MKRAFMIGVAAGALLAGVNIAAAQSTMERQQPGAAGEQKSGSGAQKPDQKQDAQKQDAQKQDAQKQGDQQKTQGAQKPDQKQDAQKQGDQQKTQGAQKPDQKQDAQKQDAQKSGDTKSGDGGKVTLSAEQKTKVRDTVIRSSNAPRVTNVNFSVTVGTAIPRETRLAPLPPLLVEIYPQWRSYHYIIVEDRIIIVEQSSFKIIAIVEV